MQLRAEPGGGEWAARWGRSSTLAPLLLLASPTAVAATRSRAVAPRAGGGACDWTIHYSRWIPTFEQGFYEVKGKDSGAKCLEACCRDPTCTGLALESSMDSQCYKYARALPELQGDRGQPLAEYVEAPRQPAWSVFVKASAAGVDPGAAAPGLLLREEQASEPTPRSVREEAAVDARLRKRLEPPHTCEWTVYYDKWIPSFQGGEYEHNNAFGGAHCLQACCDDPSCAGLALESTEMYQCYKYGSRPAALGSEHGRPLGDGTWLRERRAAWSIMVKVEKPLQTALSRGLPAKSAAAADAQASVSTWRWASALAHVAALSAMVALLVGSLASTLQRAELVGKKFIGGSCDPEATRLLETVGPLKAQPH